jgi:hypothetical protein
MVYHGNAALALPAPEIGRHLISADRKDLPEGIKAIRVKTFDLKALIDAVHLMQGPVYTVQIEPEDIPPEMMGFVHKLRTEIGYFDLDMQVFDHMTGARTTYGQISKGISAFFDEKLPARAKPEHRELLQEWKRVLLQMPKAAELVWPDAHTGMWIYGNGRTDHKDGLLPHFHRHAALMLPMSQRPRPGFFLNYVPSHDGTVFKENEKELWYGKGNCLTLHITEGHARAEGPDHASPDQFMSPIANEKRATSILQVYPSI